MRSISLIQRSFFALSTVLLLPAAVASVQTKGRIMILLANGETGSKPEQLLSRSSLWESAPSFHVFKIHGYDVDLVTPQGGRIIFSMDEDEVDPTPMVHYSLRYEGFREKANHSLSAEKLDPKTYKAAFIGGGAGAILGLARNTKVQKILAEIYQNNGVIGSCGHGAGPLAFVTLKNGDPLVKGKSLTGFPNESELKSKWTDGGKQLPFLLEEALRKNGAQFQVKADLKNKFDPIVDQRLVTGMFLGSCAAVAKEMVNVLDGIKSPPQ